MKREITKRLSIVIAVTMLFVLAVNLFLQVESARENMEQNARMTIRRIEEILESNDADYLRLTESLKEGYIVRAKTAAYMIGNTPGISRDPDEI